MAATSSIHTTSKLQYHLVLCYIPASCKKQKTLTIYNHGIKIGCFLFTHFIQWTRYTDCVHNIKWQFEFYNGIFYSSLLFFFFPF